MILGIDYGRAKMGFAVADEEAGTLATPVKVVRFKDTDEIMRVIQDMKYDYNIKSIVVGNPFSREKKASEQAHFNTFLKKINDVFGIQPEIIDEYLTTRAATRLTRDSDVTHGSEDAVAAQLILQTYLDRNI